jgi:hypothetical protein
MTRRLYRLLLRLHPRRFRERYADEMLWIFDESGGGGRLLGDAAASLVRQWAFRDGPEEASARTASGAPAFFTFDNSGPRPAALGHGVLLSVAAFLLLAMLIPHGGRRATLAAGRAWDAAWQRVSAAANASPAPVLFREAAPSRIALDLGRLDGDGVVSALDTIAAPPSAVVRVNLALVLLDSDRDGRISLAEIAGAPAALRAADRNGDGWLEWSEIVPTPIAEYLAILLSADRDGDGRVSRQESARTFPEGLFERADRNRDGFATGEELLAELR